MLPKAIKSCPKSKKSPDLVTLPHSHVSYDLVLRNDAFCKLLLTHSFFLRNRNSFFAPKVKLIFNEFFEILELPKDIDSLIRPLRPMHMLQLRRRNRLKRQTFSCSKRSSWCTFFTKANICYNISYPSILFWS